MRRLWECPVCHKLRRTGGHVVSLLCDCQARADPPQQLWMRLVEEGRRAVDKDHEPPEQSPDNPAAGAG